MPILVELSAAEDAELDRRASNLREFLRDWEDTNQLIVGEETPDRFLRWAYIHALDEYNYLPPLLGNLSITAVPEVILHKKAVANVLESAAILYTRNQLPYSDPGGMAITMADKAPGYLQLAQLFSAQWEAKTTKYKITLNIEAAWGHGIHSEYYWTQGTFYS